MRFRFNDLKTAQAAAHLLSLNGGTMAYMVLVNLLYLADRQMLLDHGMPITGDQLLLMKHGPVLSTVLDFIVQGATHKPDSAWFSLINVPKGNDVSLKSEGPPTDELSRYELELLARVYNQYGGMSRLDLTEILHKTLPEWRGSETDPCRIEYADLLRAGGRSEEDIECFERQASSAWLLIGLSEVEDA